MSTAVTGPEPVSAHPSAGPSRSGRARRSGAPRLGEWRDALLASDPGLNRLLLALQLMAALAISIGVVFGFMQLTKAMWVEAASGSTPTPAELAELAAQHRGITLLGMLMGGLIAMMACFAVQETRPREQALTMALMPIPMLATMALSIEMVPHRTLGIALLALVMGAGTYMRKFVPSVGPRAFLYGMMMFVGYLFGFLSNGALLEGQLGWIAALLWLAVLVNFLFKVLVGRPLDRGRLGRTTRAFRARCQGVVAATIALFDASGPRERERAERLLHRRLTRLNETALVIDASIADPELVSSAAAFDAHDELFELELLVQNIARVAERLASAGLPPRLRIQVRGWLAELHAGHVQRAGAAANALHSDGDGTGSAVAGLGEEDAARVHYLASAIVDLATARAEWPRYQRHGAAEGGAEVPFESPVTLVFGELPGSALASAAAAAPGAGRRGALMAKLRLDPPAQLAIRVTIAVAAAAAIGSILSERRFYWAVIAVFIAFMGANTSGEQVTKVINRVLGTVVGITIGSVLAHAVGLSSWSIAVIVVALGIGVYFMKVSYALMVVAITIVVSQLYEQLGEYSNHLLVLRLEETTLGAAVAVAAALLIFPVDTRRTTTVAARGYLEALEELLGRVSERVRGGGDSGRLTTSSRALDHANQQLLVTARPLRRTPFRRDRLEHNLALFTQTAHQARNLVAATEGTGPLEPGIADGVRTALETEAQAVAALERSFDGGDAEVSVHRLDDGLLAPLERSLALAGASRNDDRRRLLRQIDRLDETIAELHANLDSQPI